MQLAAPSVSRPDLHGRVLGSNPTTDPAKPWASLEASDRVFGEPDGYDGFEQAFIGTMKATLGDAPAAVILRLDGRFYAQGVDELGDMRAPFRFENDGRRIADVQPSDASVVAFVDGETSLIFGNPTKPQE